MKNKSIEKQDIQMVMITYFENKKTKEWLDANTGKTGMSRFIRNAVAEKIERGEK